MNKCMIEHYTSAGCASALPCACIRHKHNCWHHSKLCIHRVAVQAGNLDLQPGGGKRAERAMLCQGAQIEHKSIVTVIVCSCSITIGSYYDPPTFMFCWYVQWGFDVMVWTGIINMVVLLHQMIVVQLVADK
ncbi:hypothetical protein COO60DRAFT_608352 [Scenedesmus sp. NREL 46B-D3]|nr:hypothetical protein COO60DRAFT_608352 [Scenedesmus sp. NREL 46B-D3]